MPEHQTKPDTVGGGSEDRVRGPKLVIQRAGLDDFSTIRHVQASAVRSLVDRFIDTAEVSVATEAIYRPTYVAELAAKTLFVALINDDLVGTCAWSAGDDRGETARVSSLFVTPLFQNAGVGRQLVCEVERDAMANGYSRFSATVPVAMTPMFADLGYSTVSHGTSREVIPQVSIQVAFMRKPS